LFLHLSDAITIITSYGSKIDRLSPKFGSIKGQKNRL